MPIDPVSSTSSSTPQIFANLNLSTVQQGVIANDLSQFKSGTITKAQLQSDIQAELTPAQQQQLQSDIQAHKGHHHRPGDDSDSQTASSSTSNASQTANPLGLTSSQQSQIESLVNAAVANGTSTTELQQQIDAVLSGTQKQDIQNGTPLFSTSA